MRVVFVVLCLIFLSGVCFAENPAGKIARSQDLMNEQSLAASVVAQGGRVLIKQIVIEGFLLNKTPKMVRLFKKYRNKKLTADEVKEVVAEIRSLYVEAGYQSLVDISYKISRNKLIVFAALKS